MTITWGGSGIVVSATSGTGATISLPSGLSAGNLVVACLATKNNATHTWPSTWKVIGQTNSSSSRTFSVAWYVAKGSDANPTVSWSGSAGYIGVAAYLTGADTFYPIGNTATGTGAGTTHSVSSISTTRQNSEAVYFDFCGGTATALAVPDAYTSEVTDGGASMELTIGVKAIATQGGSAGNISSTGGSGSWVLTLIEFFSAMPPQAGDAYSSWQDVPAQLQNVELRRGVSFPRSQAPPTVQPRTPLFSPRYLPDVGYRTDPLAQGYAARNTPVTTQKPFFQPDWPNAPAWHYADTIRRGSSYARSQFVTPQIRSPVYTPHIPADVGYRTDPLAQGYAVRTAAPSYPPQAGDTYSNIGFAVPSADDKRRVDPTVQQNIRLLNALLSVLPIQAYDKLPPKGLDDRRRIDPNWQTNTDVLNQSVVTTPFYQSDWPNPRYADDKRRIDPNWQTSTNLLSAWFAKTYVTGSPSFVPRIVRDNAYRTDPAAQSNLLTLLQQVVAVPFRQSDWPLSNRILYRDYGWFNPTYIGDFPVVVAVPFVQTDWPNPRSLDDKRRIDLSTQTNLADLLNPLLILVPFTQSYSLSSSAPAHPISNRVWVWSYALGGTPTAVPFRQTDWPLSSRIPARDYAWTNWYFLGNVPIVVAPFAQTDWPTPRGLDDKRRIDPNWQTNTNALVNWFAATHVVVVPGYSLRALADLGLRTDPLAQLNLLNLLNAVQQKPFLQTDWPLANRIPYRDFAWWASLDPAAVVYPPFVQHDWPNPRYADDRRRVDPLFQQNENTTLATVIQYPPYINRDWPLPKAPLDILRTWFQGPVPSTFPILPFPNRDWPLPQSLQYPSSLRSYLVSAVIQSKPFVQSDWPIPRAADYAALLRSWLSYQIQTGQPFAQTDWPNPHTLDFPATLRSWFLSLPDSFFAKPFNQQDWPLASRIPYREFTWLQPPPFGSVTAKPFLQMDWPLTSRVPYREYSWFASLRTTTVIFPPFIQHDWPNPLGSKLPYANILRTYGYWRVPTPLASFQALKFALARRELLALARERESVALAVYRNLVAIAAERYLDVLIRQPKRFVVYSPKVEMSQAHELTPAIDVGEQETVGFDFGPALNLNYAQGQDSGVTITGSPSITAQVSAVSTVPDPNPGAMVLSDPVIVPSNYNGAPNTQVNVLLGGPQLQAGATYVVICTVQTSNGQTLIDWARWKCSQPS